MPIWAKVFDTKSGGCDKCYGRGGILIFCFGFGEWFVEARTMAWVWGATPKLNTPSKAGTPIPFHYASPLSMQVSPCAVCAPCHAHPPVPKNHFALGKPL